MATRTDGRIAHTFAPLETAASKEEIIVEGGTFRYTFSRAHGLLTSVRVLGREWLSRRPLPDLWASAEFDPRGHHADAARETKATTRVSSATAEEVVITAQGRYLSSRGEALPLRYHLTYRIACDGVIEATVENEGTGPGAISWLIFSAATLKRREVAFYSHVGDLANSENTGQWVTELLPEPTDQPVLEARFLPWLQVGNDAAGLDLTVEDAAEITTGWTDSVKEDDPLGRAHQSFVLQADARDVSWTYYSIRNLYTPLRRGWRRRNRFWLAPIPAKPVNQELNDLRVHWLGPHQYQRTYWPTDEQIASLARRGINVIIGGVNWRSGEYAKPADPKETRRIIAACHRNGIRIIPYITFTDLEYETAAYPAHGEEWQIEPAASFRHQTNLMCYGAEGWREYWKKDVDTILDRFDFDGLYIDFWVGKMACRNVLHGCGHRYPRHTLPGLRDMAWHAFRRVKEKGPQAFILCNTNLYAGALINSLVDIRLPGEWANVEETPEAIARGHLNSRRLGDTALLLRGRVRDVSLRSVSFSLRVQSPMVMSHGQAPAIEAMGPERAEPDFLLMRYADLLRFFGLAHATCQDAWQPDGALIWNQEGGTPYWCRSEKGVLLVLANLAAKAMKGKLRIAKPSAAGLSPRTRYLVYRPDARALVCDRPVPGSEVKAFDLKLAPYEPALICLTPSKGRPQPLWATLSDGFGDEQYRDGVLKVTVRGAAGGRSRVTVYFGDASVKSCRQGGKALRVKREGPLAVFEAACNAPIEMR